MFVSDDGVPCRSSVPDLRPERGEVEVRAVLGDVAGAAGLGGDCGHLVCGGLLRVGRAAAVTAFAADVFEVRRGREGSKAGLAAEADDVAADAVRVAVVAGGGERLGGGGMGARGPGGGGGGMGGAGRG